MLTMKMLENCFQGAKEQNAKYVGIVVTIPNAEEREVIINAAANFDEKLKYYQQAYDEHLNHKHVKGIQIVGFTYGNNFQEIQDDLGV
jgi:hypothetical protein